MRLTYYVYNCNDVLEVETQRLDRALECWLEVSDEGLKPKIIVFNPESYRMSSDYIDRCEAEHYRKLGI